ncbi:hypothetical protein RUM44_003216 [Polyplax serrata]|uniref:Uncharacterized protein n=1 Tax=Polyplax serrata TaxID=468196 RepID=A0ABR1AZD8_POLSC
MVGQSDDSTPTPRTCRLLSVPGGGPRPRTDASDNLTEVTVRTRNERGPPSEDEAFWRGQVASGCDTLSSTAPTRDDMDQNSNSEDNPKKEKALDLDSSRLGPVRELSPHPEGFPFGWSGVPEDRSEIRGKKIKTKWVAVGVDGRLHHGDVMLTQRAENLVLALPYRG